MSDVRTRELRRQMPDYRQQNEITDIDKNVYKLLFVIASRKEVIMKARFVGKLIIQIFFCIIAFSIFTPSAHSRLLYDGYYYTGDTFTADSRVFYVNLDNDAKIILKSGDAMLTVNMQTCGLINVTKICYNSSAFDATKRAVKARLQIHSLEPTLVITRTTWPTTAYVEQTVMINNTINNTGDLPITDIVFMDSVPEELNISSVGACVLEGNTIYWRGTLGRGQSTECIYKVIPKRSMDRILASSAAYNTGIQIKQAYSSANRLIINDFIVLRTDITRGPYYAGQIVNLTINLTNKRNNSVQSNDFIITIPESMSWEPPFSGDLKKIDSNKYRWAVDFGTNGTIQLKLSLKVFRPGVSQILINPGYTSVNENYTGNTVTIPVDAASNTIVIRTNQEDQTLESGYPYRLVVYASNPSQYLTYYDVNFTVTTNVTSVPLIHLSNISNGSTRIIFDQNFSAPKVKIRTTFNLSVDSNYTTLYGDTLGAKLRKSVYVKPIDALVPKITTSIVNIQSDDNFDVITTIKNPRTTDLERVNISDHVPSDLVLTGNATVMTNIGDGVTVTAYQYRLKAPFVGERKDYIINTTIVYVENVTKEIIEEYKETKITVNPKKMKIIYTRKAFDPIILRRPTIYNHTILNNDAEPIYNVTVSYPLQQGILVGLNSTRTISVLNPREQVTLTEIERIWYEEEGIFTVEPATIYFNDKNGRLYNVSSGSLRVTVKKGFGDNESAMIYAVKRINNATLSNIYGVDITILLNNTGSVPATNIFVDDNGKIMTLAYLGEKSATEFNYVLSSDKLASGKNNLTKAIITYSDSFGAYNTASNDLIITYAAGKNNANKTADYVPEQKTNNTAGAETVPKAVVGSVNQTSLEQMSAAAAEKTAKPGFFAGIWNAIKALFGKKSTE